MNFFLENSLLDDNYLHEFFTKHLDESSINNIYIDKSLFDLSQSSSIDERVLKVRAYLELFKKLGTLEIVETKNFKVTEPIESLIKQLPQLTFVTQNETIVKRINDYFDQKEHKIARIEHRVLKDWKLQRTNLNAFYDEQNKYKFGMIDSKQIDYVLSPKYGYLKLDENPMYSGGEGEIFKTYQGFVAKIFKNTHQTYNNYKKLDQMINTPINNHLIVWPKDVIYSNGAFVGYVMDHIHGVGSMDDLRDNGSAVFSYIDRVQIIITFLKNIKYLHDRNILVGDMKFDNTLVKSPKEVFIIDTGSFQIEDYPCVVYNPVFSEKRYTKDELKKQLRTIESEYYPINKIIYETFFFKSPFYSPTNLEIGEDEIRDFKLSLTPPKDSTQIESYQKPWFGVPLKIRENFYYYFKENKITYLSELINDFSEFKSQLERRKTA